MTLYLEKYNYRGRVVLALMNGTAYAPPERGNYRSFHFISFQYDRIWGAPAGTCLEPLFRDICQYSDPCNNQRRTHDRVEAVVCKCIRRYDAVPIFLKAKESQGKFRGNGDVGVENKGSRISRLEFPATLHVFQC